MQDCLEKLQKRKEQNLLRKPKENHRNLIDFGSNDYFGLAKRCAVQKMSGSTGSRLLSGAHDIFDRGEAYLAKTFLSPSALSFQSGYSANLGFFGHLLGKEDVLIYDEYIHASIRDGGKLSGAKRFNFRHNDIDHLAERLKKACGRKIIVAVESVYSMDGDLAPLKEIALLCEKENAYLVVDEAHAVGVFNKGRVIEEKILDKVFARIITFGKAIGSHGACILGPEWLKEYLYNYCHSFIYTTAPNPSQFEETLENIKLCLNDKNLHKSLWENIQLFEKLCKKKCSSPIISWGVKSISLARKAEEELRLKGFYCSSIVSPTVQRGKERLRICLHAQNTPNEIKSLWDELKDYA